MLKASGLPSGAPLRPPPARRGRRGEVPTAARPSERKPAATVRSAGTAPWRSLRGDCAIEPRAQHPTSIL
eukprot:8555117-Prorocentrum_lima.AAC.1